jgi:hypothetical protein
VASILQTCDRKANAKENNKAGFAERETPKIEMDHDYFLISLQRNVIAYAYQIGYLTLTPYYLKNTTIVARSLKKREHLACAPLKIPVYQLVAKGNDCSS